MQKPTPFSEEGEKLPPLSAPTPLAAGWVICSAPCPSLVLLL